VNDLYPVEVGDSIDDLPNEALEGGEVSQLLLGQAVDVFLCITSLHQF